MKSKLITAALVAIAGFAIADLIRAALFPNAARLAIDTGRSDSGRSDAPAAPLAGIVGDAAATAGAPEVEDENTATASTVETAVSDAAGDSPATAPPVTSAATVAAPRERHIVIQPGSDLVVVETDVPPAAEAAPEVAIIPSSIGEAAAREAGTVEANIATADDPAAPRISTAAPAPGGIIIEPAALRGNSDN